MKRALITAVIIISMLGALLVWMAGGIQSPRTFEYPAISHNDVVRETQTSTTITVIVWNIAWGYGWGSEGTGKARPRAHFEQSLARIGEFIKKSGADLALIQEIDFRSRRSGDIDQGVVLSQHSGLDWVAEALSWDANWVPFPYWPPSEHFGNMRSGGAILSRYPITKNEVRLLDKPDEYPWYYRLFYLFRYLQKAEVDVHGRTLTVFNTHLEAFKQKNREDQAKLVRELLAASPKPDVIFAGDLNAVPPESTRKGDYPDETNVVTSHETDSTVTVLRTTPGLSDSFPAEKYLADEKAHFTFPAHAPNRKLDHLFFGTGFELVDARVGVEAGDVSDHLPLIVRLRLK